MKSGTSFRIPGEAPTAVGQGIAGSDLSRLPVSSVSVCGACYMNGAPMPRRKFDGVPTESMFDDAEVEALREEKPKPERAKTIASGRCPECSNGRLGVVRQGEHLLWREHYYTTWAGVPIICRASGVATCVAPERLSKDYPNHVAVLCPHTREAEERIWRAQRSGQPPGDE